MEKFFIESFDEWEEISDTVYVFYGVVWRDSIKKILPEDADTLTIDTKHMVVEFKSKDVYVKHKIQNLIFENGLRVDAP